MNRAYAVFVWVFCAAAFLAGDGLPVFEIKSHGFVSVFRTQALARNFGFKHYGLDFTTPRTKINGVWITKLNSHYRTPIKDGIIPSTVTFFWLRSSGYARNSIEHGGSDYPPGINLKDIEPCLPLLKQDERAICQRAFQKPDREPQAFIINFFEITKYSFIQAAPSIDTYLFKAYQASYLYTNIKYCESIVKTMHAEGVEITSYWRVRLYFQYLQAKSAVSPADDVIDDLEAEVNRLKSHLPTFYRSFLLELSANVERRRAPFEKWINDLVVYPEPMVFQPELLVSYAEGLR